MPGAAPRTSSEALVHATLGSGLQLADQGARVLTADTGAKRSDPDRVYSVDPILSW